MISPKAIAAIAIFIIGAEMLILCSLPLIRRFAINCHRNTYPQRKGSIDATLLWATNENHVQLI